MDTVLDCPWTTERFLAWEDRQEGKHEFDGRRVVRLAGSSVAHQRIVMNTRTVLTVLLAGGPIHVTHSMRLRAGPRVRYPDVIVCAGPLDQTTRTLDDAIAIFEVLSDDTATTDRVEKVIDYAMLPSLRSYVLLEQTAIAATLFRRDTGGPWIATPHTGGSLTLAGIEISLPLADVYQGLTFAT